MKLPETPDEYREALKAADTTSDLIFIANCLDLKWVGTRKGMRLRISNAIEKLELAIAADEAAEIIGARIYAAVRAKRG